jgi:hypothetical protein
MPNFPNTQPQPQIDLGPILAEVVTALKPVLARAWPQLLGLAVAAFVPSLQGLITQFVGRIVAGVPAPAAAPAPAQGFPIGSLLTTIFGAIATAAAGGLAATNVVPMDMGLGAAGLTGAATAAGATQLRNSLKQKTT